MKNIGSWVLVLGLGCVLLLIGAVLLWNGIDFARRAEKAQGTVIGLKETRSDRRISYAPMVRFTTHTGMPVHFTSRVSSSPPAYTKGQTVKVLYDPDSPTIARIDTFMQVYGLGALIFVIGCAACAASFAVRAALRRAQTSDSGSGVD